MSLSILLVDDNLTFLASVKHSLLLVPNVHVLDEAHNGMQALAMVQSLHPKLVLLDIMIGLDVAKTILSWEQAPQVIFLTMHDNDSYRAEAKALGALGLVGKANFVADLLPMVTSLAASAPGAAT